MASPLATVASLVIRVGVDPTGVRMGMAKVQSEVRAGMAGVQAQTGAMSALAGKAVGGLALATVAAAAIGTKAFAEFDQAMTESLAIMGDVSDEMRDKMERAARDVATSTTFSATQAAESYYFLASAGLSAEAQLSAMPRVAAFAQAGMFDMALATDLLTDAQSALGMTVRDDAIKNLENMNRVGDVLVKANTLANASVQQFSEAITNGAGAALRSVNKDIEEGTAVLAAYADQGIKGLLAGSSLDRLIRMMPSAALKNADAYERLGIEVFDSAGNMLHFGDIVTDITDALDGMSDAEKTIALESLGFKARLQGIIKPLLGTGQLIKDYDSGLRDAGGMMDEVAANQLESFNSQLNLLKSELMDIAMTIGEALLPHLMNLVKLVKGIVGPVGDWISNNKALVDSIMPIVTALAAVKAASMGMKMAGFLVPGMGGLATSMGPLGTKLGSLFGKAFAAAAVVYLLFELKNAWDDFNKTVADSQEALSENVSKIAEQSTSEALDNMEQTTKYMREVQGWQRIVGDTWGGEQQMDSLLGFADRLYEARAEMTRSEIERSLTLLMEAEAAAIERGNQKVATSLANTRAVLEQRLDTAPATRAPDVTAPAAAAPPVPTPNIQPAIKNVGRQLAGARAVFRSAMLDALAPFVEETQNAWDHVQSILKGQPPKIIPMEQRMKQVGRAMRKAYKNLNKAVEADDPIAAAYWEQELLKVKNTQNTFKNANSRSWKSIKKDLDAAGIDHSRFTGKWSKAKAAMALAEKKNARKTAAALPTEMAAKQAELETVIARTESIVSDPLSALPTSAQSWGSSMGVMFAAGIRSQVAEVAAAANELAAAAAVPIESNSPPKAGPLRNIDKWGGPLVDAWVGGIRGGIPSVRGAADDLGRAMSPSVADPRGSGRVAAMGGSQGAVHIHVGTLIADDRGIDELKRRMDRRTAATSPKRKRDWATAQRN